VIVFGSRCKKFLVFGNSAFYLNIILEIYQVLMGHHLGQRIIHFGEEFVKISNLGFRFKG